MTSLKKYIDDTQMDQMELPIGKESENNVVQISPNTQNQAEVTELLNKKNELIEEIERLNLYVVQNQKKLHDAKSFIEQYERVVSNKQQYIGEVEFERENIIKEIESLDSKKKIIEEELEQTKFQIEESKKQYELELKQLQSWDSKVLEKQHAYQEIQNKYADVESKILKSQAEYEKNESSYREMHDIFLKKQNEILVLESQVDLLKRQFEEKLNDSEKISEIQTSFSMGYETVEKELLHSINRLKSDESTWRSISEQKYEEVEKVSAQFEALTNELVEKKQEQARLHIEIESYRSQLNSLEYRVLSEKHELENIAENKMNLENHYRDLKDEVNRLQAMNEKESIEVEHLRSKKWVEKNELTKLMDDKELKLEILKELEFKKQDLQKEFELTRLEMIEKINYETVLKQKEFEVLKAAQESDFRKKLELDKKQMHENYWLGMKSKLDAFSHEVVSYVTSSFQMNIDPQQELKLKTYLSSLMKHHEDMDINHTKRSVLSYLKQAQPYLIASTIVLQIVLICLALK